MIMKSAYSLFAILLSISAVFAFPRYGDDDNDYWHQGRHGGSHWPWDSDCGHEYVACNRIFNKAKQYCARKYGGSGTRHGRCIDRVVSEFDQCILMADEANEYCWRYKSY
ncbi:hypothetical protein HK102_009069 [Quaeritorhiza haematococci]|nr:hypothetical protein HK102_009069 [Quaeritorhiza haematococci]